MDDVHRGAAGDTEALVHRNITGFIACCSLIGISAHAQSSRQFVTREGSLEVADGAASIAVPDDWRLLAGSEARRVLQELWGNDGDASVVALALPPQIEGRAPWAAVIRWERGGAIRSDRALPDPTSLLELARAQIAAQPGMQPLLCEWSAVPRWDSGTGTLEWGTRLRFPGDEFDSINLHHVWLLRQGWLQATVLCPVPALDLLATALQATIECIDVRPGHRWTEVDPSLDVQARLGPADIVIGKHMGQHDAPAPPARAPVDEVAPSAATWTWPVLACAAALLGFGVVRRLLPGQRTAA